MGLTKFEMRSCSTGDCQQEAEVNGAVERSLATSREALLRLLACPSCSYPFRPHDFSFFFSLICGTTHHACCRCSGGKIVNSMNSP